MDKEHHAKKITISNYRGNRVCVRVCTVVGSQVPSLSGLITTVTLPVHQRCARSSGLPTNVVVSFVELLWCNYAKLVILCEIVHLAKQASYLFVHKQQRSALGLSNQW